MDIKNCFLSVEVNRQHPIGRDWILQYSNTEFVYRTGLERIGLSSDVLYCMTLCCVVLHSDAPFRYLVSRSVAQFLLDEAIREQEFRKIWFGGHIKTIFTSVAAQ